MKRFFAVLLVGLAGQSSFAEETGKLHSTEIDGEILYGHLTLRVFGELEIDWFKPCPPKTQGYPQEDLELVAEVRSDCPNLIPPSVRPRRDSFDGQSPTVADLRSRGRLNCGVSAGIAGFAEPDASGEWQGFDVAICRAVAAAVLGDATAVEFVPTTNRTRFTALASGEVDILARNTAWTFSRDVELNYEFVGVNYYDGQGFMVPKDLGVSSALELDGATVCIQTGTTTELALADYFGSNQVNYEPVPVETDADAVQAYLSGSCDVFTSDVSAMGGVRAEFETPGDHMILPEIISREPLGPLVRHGDQEWGDIVRWTLNALIVAEELGVTSENVAELSSGTDNPEINRLLGAEGQFGGSLGLSSDWATTVISSVGNYGEIFADTLGEETPIGLARGLNAQWTDGGLLYSPPFR